MEIVFRTIGIYLALLLLFRIMGKRSMTQLTTFDLILFLIISEAIQSALVDSDQSVVMGLIVIVIFVMLDFGMSLLKKRYSTFERVIEGIPTVLVDHGKVLENQLSDARLSHSDILQVARQTQGLERMDQIKYAVLEVSGGISIIPREAGIEERLSRIEAALERLANRNSFQGH